MCVAGWQEKYVQANGACKGIGKLLPTLTKLMPRLWETEASRDESRWRPMERERIVKNITRWTPLGRDYTSPGYFPNGKTHRFCHSPESRHARNSLLAGTYPCLWCNRVSSILVYIMDSLCTINLSPLFAVYWTLLGLCHEQELIRAQEELPQHITDVSWTIGSGIFAWHCFTSYML